MIPSDHHSPALDLSDKTQYALQYEEEIATASSLVEPEEVNKLEDDHDDEPEYIDLSNKTEYALPCEEGATNLSFVELEKVNKLEDDHDDEPENDHDDEPEVNMENQEAEAGSAHNTSTHQFYIRLADHEKALKLQAILEALDFNQVIVLVNSDDTACKVNSLVSGPSCLYPSTVVVSTMADEEKTHCLRRFYDGESRVLVSNGLVSFGPRVNIIINFDTSLSVDQYLRSVGRSHNLATVCITFVSNDRDYELISQVQGVFEGINIMPPEKTQSRFTHAPALSFLLKIAVSLLVDSSVVHIQILLNVFLFIFKYY